MDSQSEPLDTISKPSLIPGSPNLENTHSSENNHNSSFDDPWDAFEFIDEVESSRHSADGPWSRPPELDNIRWADHHNNHQSSLNQTNMAIMYPIVWSIPLVTPVLIICKLVAKRTRRDVSQCAESKAKQPPPPLGLEKKKQKQENGCCIPVLVYMQAAQIYNNIYIHPRGGVRRNCCILG